jgi:hypothetical protein
VTHAARRRHWPVQDPTTTIKTSLRPPHAAGSQKHHNQTKNQIKTLSDRHLIVIQKTKTQNQEKPRSIFSSARPPLFAAVKHHIPHTTNGLVFVCHCRRKPCGRPWLAAY